jgi:hypothetical protein
LHYDEEIEENLVLLCMKARQWVWHPDKAKNYSTLDPKSYSRSHLYSVFKVW